MDIDLQEQTSVPPARLSSPAGAKEAPAEDRLQDQRSEPGGKDGVLKRGR